jgi:putative thioredoxin
MSDAPSPYIVDLTPENFVQVIQASQHTPVLVDFWAEWCEPCKQLMPLLAKLADEYQGRFFLAKLNTEQYQELAAQFGIRSIPNCKLFVNAQIVDEFSGALPESAVREFLDKHLPRPSDSLVAQAEQALQGGDADGAMALLQQAKAEDPGNVEIDITIARLHAISGDSTAAMAVLDALPAEHHDNVQVQSLRSQLQFQAEAEGLLDPATLARRLAADEHDSEARYQMAIHQVLGQDYQGALDILMELMRDDRGYNDDAARKTMLKIFDLLGDDPLAARYRSRMFTLLH